MANEDMIGGSIGESSAQNKGTHSEEEAWHTAGDLKSAAPTVAKDYAEEASAVFDEAKERTRTLREDGEDYVRKNPVKAVFTALGVGFLLGFTFRH
jgi:ElaB/YqjD/DUF883 family membrane-anchored ribosome-binding protein